MLWAVMEGDHGQSVSSLTHPEKEHPCRMEPMAASRTRRRQKDPVQSVSAEMNSHEQCTLVFAESATDTGTTLVMSGLTWGGGRGVLPLPGEV